MKIRVQWCVKTGHRWEPLAAPCLKTIQPANDVTCRRRCRGCCYTSVVVLVFQNACEFRTRQSLFFFFCVDEFCFSFCTNKTPYPLTLFRIEIITLKCIVQKCFEWTGNNNTLLSLMQCNASKCKFHNRTLFNIKFLDSK